MAQGGRSAAAGGGKCGARGSGLTTGGKGVRDFGSGWAVGLCRLCVWWAESASPHLAAAAALAGHLHAVARLGKRRGVRDDLGRGEERAGGADR